MSRRLELVRWGHTAKRQQNKKCYAFECKCEIVTVAIGGIGWLADDGSIIPKLSLSITLLPSLSDIVLRVTVAFFLSFMGFCFHSSVGAL